MAHVARADAEAQLYAPMLEAAARFVSGDLSGARVILRQAARKRATVAVETARMIVALGDGDVAEVLAAHGRAVALGGDDPDLHYFAAILELKRKQPGKALVHLERAISVGGERPAYLVAQATALRALGRAEEAERALLGAARKEADLLDPRLYPDLGRGMIRVVERALRGYPNRHRLRLTVAQLLLQAKLFR